MKEGGDLPRRKITYILIVIYLLLLFSMRMQVFRFSCPIFPEKGRACLSHGGSTSLLSTIVLGGNPDQPP